jgi:4-amino-4-deoxy-L-arabinose transferase-like glycosyltransferase
MGCAAGIALQAKYLIAFWLAGLGAGLLATRARRWLLSPYLYGGAALAVLIALPNILWQATHDWPFIELGRVAVERKKRRRPAT